jgi:anti-sigma B factor antagonist
MTITKNVNGDECELLLGGRIDGPAANQLEEELIAMTRGPWKTAYLNLTNADFLCSAALRVILQNHRQWQKQGRKCVVSRASAEVSEILELTGFADTLVEKT